MKRMMTLAGMAIAVGLAAPVSAEDRIATVDVQRILEESNAGRIARDLLKQTTRRARAQIDEMRSQLETLQKRYDSQKSILKPDAREELEQQIVETQLELRQTLQQSQMELQDRDTELTSAILEDLKPIIEALAKEKGLTLVIESGEAGVLFAADKLDLTDVILKRYDESKKN